jgi:hypothetical protein
VYKSSSNNITNNLESSLSSSESKYWKKVWEIGPNRIHLVALEKSIVQKLKINGNDTFLEQEVIEDGILMKIRRIST